MDRRARALIAGAGVAGLEAALAIRRHAPGLVDVTLLAPAREFVYRPLTVAEPFGAGGTLSFDLARLADRAGAGLINERLAAIEAVDHRIVTDGGAAIDYDMLILAMGARPRPSVDGTLAFGLDPGGFEDFLARLGRRGSRSVAYVVPTEACWALAAYELALLTAAEARERNLLGTEITLVTHERSPLEAFGSGASELVAEHLDHAGVRLLTRSTAVSHEEGTLHLSGRADLPCDAAVALPRLEVGPIAGVTQRAGGFVAVDTGMRVGELDAVWAAGDVTAFPIKQGGLASQQADVAARGVAVAAGAHVPVEPFQPVLRAVLITGGAPEFLRARRGMGDAGFAHSREPLWWPPEKLAGRYLGPLLAAESEGVEFGELIDLDPPDDPVGADAETEAAVSLLLGAAEADARAGELGKALAALELVERLDLVLPPGYVALRERWRRLAGVEGAAAVAESRIDPALGGPEAALSDIQHRIGRLRELENGTTRRMRGDLARLDEGMAQLRVLSKATGLPSP